MQLRVVDLSGNQLTGTLPKSWGNLTKVSCWPMNVLAAQVLEWLTRAPEQVLVLATLLARVSGLLAKLARLPDPKLSGCIAAEIFGRQQQQHQGYFTNRLGRPGAGQGIAAAFALLDHNIATFTTILQQCLKSPL